jgi:uncharacterized repeat protein (TIGR01451 family)
MKSESRSISLMLSFALIVIVVLGTIAMKSSLRNCSFALDEQSPRTGDEHVQVKINTTSGDVKAVFASALAKPDEASRARIVESYGKMPLSFEENIGQTDARVKYLSRGDGYTLFITKRGEAVMTLPAKPPNLRPRLRLPSNPIQATERRRQGSLRQRKAVLTMRFKGANPNAEVSGGEPSEGKVNYLIGNDPSKWQTRVSTCSKVKHEGVYPGVDVVYYGNQRQLEYDVLVSPGTNPDIIEITFDGSKKLKIDGAGELALRVGRSEVRLRKPAVYQVEEGQRKDVEARYVVRGRNSIGFKIGEYDTDRTLVIDPILLYSTFLGGSNDENPPRIAVDTAGNAYIAGSTTSTDFPLANPFQSQFRSLLMAFVTKINSGGNALVYSTFLGGSFGGGARDITVDTTGNAYVVGSTASTDFPTVNALQAQLGGGQGDLDAFVAKLNATGSALIYSTYLGGGASDDGYHIAIDTGNNAYVSGFTQSTNFPTLNPIQAHFGGKQDVFVAKISERGNSLIYSTYLGGSDAEISGAIAVDSLGEACVVGFTLSADFPTFNALQTQIRNADRGFGDGFVAKLNIAGSAFVYSTYLGGSGGDQANGVAVDASGNAYVVGVVGSTDFPTMNALQPQLRGNANAFVTKINAAGSGLVYSTYLGGSSVEEAYGITVDSTGNAYVVGRTLSTDFPTSNPIQAQYHGGIDVFVAKLNAAGSALIYSTYLGGSGADYAYGVALDTAGGAYVVGTTASSDFPTANPIQERLRGGSDAFIAKIAEIPGSATDLSLLQKGSFTSVISGSTYNYTTTVKNNGPSPASNVLVTTSTPPGTSVELVSSTNGAVTAPPIGGSGQITCSIASMNVGETVEIRLTIKVLASAGTTIICTASVTTSTPEPITSNNSSSVSTRVIAATTDADVRIVQIVNDYPYYSNNVGAPLFYTIVVGNEGPATATGVRLTFLMQEGTTFERVISPQGIFTTPAPGQRGNVVGSLGSLVAGQSVEITVAVKNERNISLLDVTARVTATSSDPNSDNNEIRHATSYGQHEEYQGTPIVDAPASIAAGTRLAYRIAFNKTLRGAPFTIYGLIPEGTTFSSATINSGSPLSFRVPPVGSRGAVLVSAFDVVVLTVEVNVLARPGTVLENLVGVNGLTGSIVKTTTLVAGGSIVDLLWQQPSAPSGPITALSSPPFNLQVRPASFSSETGLFASRSADEAGCQLLKVNIYKTDQPCVQTIPTNLWKSVPPEQVQTEMSAAPAGSFYVLTNVWSCGGVLFESGRSNECSSAGMCANCATGTASPQITNVEKSGKNLVITGANFFDGSKIFVNGEAGKTIYESVTQLTGKKLGKTTSRGARIRVRNPDGSLSNEWTY